MNSHPLVIFLIGLFILALFLWYFAADTARRKRAVGTALAIVLTAFCIYAITPPAEKLKLGIDLQGGNSFILQLQKAPESEKSLDAAAQQMAIAVIEKRLNQEGNRDLLIAPQGADRILIQMPGITEEESKWVEEQIKRVARLEFSILHPQSSVLAPRVQAGEEVVPGWVAKEDTGAEPDAEGKYPFVLVKIRPDLVGNVKRAFPQLGPQGWIILLEFNATGAKRFDEIANEHFQEQLAIIMDGKVLSTPVLQARSFGGTASISGRFSPEEARDLASALENPLESEIKILNRYEVSPTMGTEMIRQGVIAGLAGLAATMIFVIFYYKFAGMVAVIGVFVNIVFLLGAMAIFEFTLTLPGIAGIILTIGIAIDANVLIYERLREELKAGKSLTAAIDAAYHRAFSAIFDANITTLITALILFMVASGTIKGFAVTLTIGILASLFSALVVTRLCFDWSTERGLFKNLDLWNIIPEANIDFLGRRRIALGGSAIAIVLVIALIAVKGAGLLGVDFRGGDLITVRATADVSEKAVLESIADMDVAQQPYVQTLNAAGGGDFITIRSAFDTGDRIIAEIRKDLGQEFADATQETVGPVIGREMAKSSLVALLLGILGIFIYMSIRFEFSFAIGAIVALLHDLVIAFGVVAITGREMSLILVGAFLTIAGYSINDTIVIFDRIREGLRSRRGEVIDVMNFSINATLSRTLLTSSTTLFTLACLYFFGGPGMNDFAFAMFVGIVIGTFSSIFVASPIVLWWSRARKTNLRREILDAEQAAVKPASAP